MKRLIVPALFVFLSGPLAARENLPGPPAVAKPTPPPNPEDFRLEKIHEVPGISKKEIFDRSLEWFARTFKDSKAVIELKDLEKGQIIGKGIAEADTRWALGSLFRSYRFTIIIDIQEGRYRTTYESFTGVGSEHGDWIVKDAKEARLVKESGLVPVDEELETFVKAAPDNKW